MSNFVLSQGTADKLKALLNTSGGSGAGASGGSNRQEGWIIITSDKDEETGYYEGTVSYYDAVTEAWQTFAGIKGLAANEEDALTAGKRYIGQRSGDTLEGDSVWIISGNDPSYCCGLKIAGEDDPSECDEGSVIVDGASLAGTGINWQDSCQFYLEKGCGITFEGGKKIGVHAGDLAGPGLIATTGCKLEVNAGQCLEVDENGKLNVKLSGTFSAITAFSVSGCTINYTTSAFAFNGCNLEQVSYLDSSVAVPCCCTSPPPPPSQYWCYAGSCSTTQTEGASGPFSTSEACSAACTTTPPTDCHDCDFSVTINGTEYAFESFGGDGYIAAGPDGHYLYMTPPTTCSAYWLVQLYDGSLEICNWESHWDGTGCGTLEQGTNNGIQFTQCPASEVSLCCNGGDSGPQWWCKASACIQQVGQPDGATGPYESEAACNQACQQVTLCVYPSNCQPPECYQDTSALPECVFRCSSTDEVYDPQTGCGGGGDNPCLGGTCDFYWSPSDPNAVNGWVATNGQCSTNCTCNYPTEAGTNGQTITGRTCKPVTQQHDTEDHLPT